MKYLSFFFPIFKTNFSVLKLLFLYRNFYFRTGINIVVRLYTVMYFSVLKNVVAQPMNMFVLEFMFLY